MKIKNDKKEELEAVFFEDSRAEQSVSEDKNVIKALELLEQDIQRIATKNKNCMVNLPIDKNAVREFLKHKGNLDKKEKE